MEDKGQSGHRKRLRERFLAGESDARSDELLLELLLTFAIPRKDTRPLAQDLIKAFGDVSKVFSASSSDLDKIEGLGQSSVALLKVVSSIQSRMELPKKQGSPAKRKAPIQQKLFEEQGGKKAPEGQSQESLVAARHQIEPETKPNQPDRPNETSRVAGAITGKITLANQPLPSKETQSLNTIDQRKLQVSNGYPLEFDQLARILHFILEHRGAKKLNLKALQEDTGLAERQVEGLISIGSAMGLIKPRLQVLTPEGLLLAEHDIFLERKGSLEWCHYKGAGSYQNLMWFEVFNRLLVEKPATTHEGWLDYFRETLSGQYADKTIRSHVAKEVRFIIDAYLNRNFGKLEILHQSSDERLYRQCHIAFVPLVLAAMIYDYCAANKAQLSQVAEMATSPGSPAVVFGLDVTSCRQQVEGLHDRGWLRYETTHNLDQIRLKPGFSALEFLTAHFEDREPRAAST